MMMRAWLRSVLLAALVVTASAEARDEIHFSSLGLTFGGDTTKISVSPGYNHQLLEWLQVGASLNYQSLSYGASDVTTYTLQAGPTINIGPIENAIFFSLGYAIRKGDGAGPAGAASPDGSGLYLYGGRRFGFGDFAYSPSIGVQTAGGTSILLNLLSLSYFL